MPPLEVYRVDFSNGTLAPVYDANGWGAMRYGGTSTGNLQRNFVTGGLYLSAERPLDAQDQGVANSIYVVPPMPGMVPLESRLLMRVEFDLPDAVPASPDVKAEPWAAGLKLKFANQPGEPPERDVLDEPMIIVTCQFNNNTLGRNGVRLNDPSRAQDAATNKATDLDSPLSYDRYKGWWWLIPPTRFILSFAFSGIQAGPAPDPRSPGDPLGYAVGCGFLEMSSWVLVRKKWEIWTWFRRSKKDLRLFSSTQLSTGNQTWIGALGVSLATVSGQGTIMARLRRFTISTWT